MRYKWLIISSFWVFSLPLLGIGISSGNDLDDGISLDDNVGKYDSIRTDDNIRFIKRKAKADAAASAQTNQGNAVIGGVAIGQGTTIKGDVTVVFEGKNINQTIVDGK